jgi:hypothetical protein
MSYLRYLCLLAYNDVQCILCCVFFPSCVPYACQFLWIVHFDCPFDILKRLLNILILIVD